MCSSTQNVSEQYNDPDSRAFTQSNIDGNKNVNGSSCSIDARTYGLSNEHVGCICTTFHDDIQDIKTRLLKLESSMREDLKLVLGLLKNKQNSSTSMLPERTSNGCDIVKTSAPVSNTNIYYDCNIATTSKV